MHVCSVESDMWDESEEENCSDVEECDESEEEKYFCSMTLVEEESWAAE